MTAATKKEVPHAKSEVQEHHEGLAKEAWKKPFKGKQVREVRKEISWGNDVE